MSEPTLDREEKTIEPGDVIIDLNRHDDPEKIGRKFVVTRVDGDGRVFGYQIVDTDRVALRAKDCLLWTNKEALPL